MYDQAFTEMDWVNPVKVRDYNVSCYHLYVIHVSERDRLQVHLKNSGVATGLHYPVPLHHQECYRHLNLAEDAYPNAEKSAAQLLSLPMFPELTEQQICHVAESVRSFQQ
jgi:dTDP-4-amino-4,6-dideoxygalactose transaminase